MKRRNARGSYKWYKKESEENSMEGRGRSRRRNTHQAWKKRLSSVLAVVLTAVMILNMPLSIDGLRMHVSDAFASASNADRDSGVWATASNAKYRKGDSGDVDIYVIADDNGAVPGNTTSMTLYLKNNTDQAISEGVLTFSGRYINKEDAIFQDVGSGEEYEQIIAGGGPGQAGEESGEGLIYQESEETADETMAPDAAESIGSADEGIETADPVLPEDSGSEGDEEEEEAYKLTNIDLLPGELHEVHFEFYTDDDVKSTKANVSFSFRGENEEGSRVTGDTKFYYSIGLPTVNFSMEDGMQIESGISNDLEIWMSEPDWVDEDLQDRLDEQEEKEGEENDAADTASDSDASKASDSNASKDNTASDSNAGKDSSTSQKDEEKIQKYTEEAMEISSSRVSYTVEIYGADYSEFHPRKAEEAEDIGWISCVYEVDRNTKPGIYYGKVTATGKWNKKSFTSEQGFLFEVTGEGIQEYTEETDNVIVRASAPASVFDEEVKLVVKELPEGSDGYQEAEEALKAEDVLYEGMKALDITFVNEDGEEIEPNGEVQVSIQMKEGVLPEDADLETVEVHHLKAADANTVKAEAVADGAEKTDGTVLSAEEAAAELEAAEISEEEVEAAIDKDAAAVAMFSVDSFSTFTITWGSRNSVTVYYVDQAGNEIQGNQNRYVSVGNGNWVNLDQYGTEISGYTYQGAHLNSYNGTPAKRVKYESDWFGHGEWRYSNNTDSWDNGRTWSTTGYGGRNIYLVYTSSTALTTVETVDSAAEGVHMYMFDYGSPAFSDNIGGYGDGSTKTGLASSTVNPITGWPTLIANRTSFSEYFGDSYSAYDVSSDDAVNNLFLQENFDRNGEFYFNSAEYFATLENDRDENFTVYNQLGTPSGENAYFYQRGNFMPYNTLNPSDIRNHNLYDDTGARLDSSDPRYNEPIYGFNETNNFYFGMYVWADFYQPKGGMVEDNDGSGSSPMVFEFTGDDDMWVYIDGVLVLDLGGIHDAQSGTIDFETGNVRWTVTETGDEPTWRSSTLRDIFANAGEDTSTDWDGNTFADGSNHRIQIFYMERGAGASNLKMRFNLKTIPDGQMSVRKEVDNYYAPQLKDVEYTMQATVNGEPYANQPYTFFEQEGDGTTDSNGQFKLKHDQTAVFENLTVGDEIEVKEVNVGDVPDGVDVEEAYNISYTVTDSSGQVIEGGEATEKPVSAEMPPYGSITFTVTNKATFTRPLKLVKTFDGTEENKAPANFEATYTLYEVGIDGKETEVGSIKYSDMDEAQDEMSASYIFWLETGKNYTIKESFADGDNAGDTDDLFWKDWTISANNPAYGTEDKDGIVYLEATDDIEGDGIDTLTVTNIYSGKTVKISVDKVVTGNMGDKDETFTFTYSYLEYGETKTGSFTLKDASSPREIEIPYGATVTIEETGNGTGYTTSYVATEDETKDQIASANGTSCKLENVMSDATIVFTNHKQVQTPTGLYNNPHPYLLMLAIAAVGTAGFIYPACRRRRSKDDK